MVVGKIFLASGGPRASRRLSHIPTTWCQPLTSRALSHTHHPLASPPPSSPVSFSGSIKNCAPHSVPFCSPHCYRLSHLSHLLHLFSFQRQPPPAITFSLNPTFRHSFRLRLCAYRIVRVHSFDPTNQRVWKTAGGNTADHEKLSILDITVDIGLNQSS